MLISEITFPHLQAEREAQLTRELERRRVLNERLDGERPGAATTAHASRSPRKARHATVSAKRRSGDELTAGAWVSTLKA